MQPHNVPESNRIPAHRMENWDWELTLWSQRILRASIIGDVAPGALIALGLATGNHVAFEIGVWGAAGPMAATFALGTKDIVEVGVR